MKSQFKSNNFVAILIALLLFATGFVLYFIHQQAQAAEGLGSTQTGITTNMTVLSAYSNNRPIIQRHAPLPELPVIYV
jgi:hypothetical protein